MRKEIPEISLTRLPIYLNYLRSLPNDANACISSGAIAAALDMGEVLVRKDLAYTKAIGKPKLGYIRAELIEALEDFLCCNTVKNAVIIGAGELGKALMGYNGFDNYGIKIVAAFDIDKDKIGTKIFNKPVLDINELESGINEYLAQFAILCVPAAAAQSVIDSLGGKGLKGVLNFAPVQLSTPGGLTIRNIDLAGSMSVLAALTE